MKKFLMAILWFAFGLAACVQAETQAPNCPTNVPLQTPTPPESVNPDGMIYPPPNDANNDPDGYCDASGCLSFVNVNDMQYPIGYTKMVGYYQKVSRIEGDKRKSCDGFVIQSAHRTLLQAYKDHFMWISSVYSEAVDGNPLINIPLWNENEATKDVIYKSSPTKPVLLYVINTNSHPSSFQWISCFSPIDIIHAVKPITREDLSNDHEITEEDNGKVFTYVVTSGFTVILDETRHPSKDLKCTPAGMYGMHSNGTNPFGYPKQYGITRTGVCKLQNGDFEVTIEVVEMPID